MSPEHQGGSGSLPPENAPKPRTGLVTLLFTDMVGSTALKQQLGDQAGAALFRRHHQLVRELLARFPAGQEIETAGDSFLMVFATPSDAVRFGLVLQTNLRQLREKSGVSLSDRVGIHIGEVVLEGDGSGARPRELYGIQIDTCARVMSLAKADQILMSRGVFDSARQVLKGEDIEGVKLLEWLNHGLYLLKGLDEPVEICEVRESGRESAPGPPTTSDKAQRQVRPDEEPVLGWRPAVGQAVPNTRWVLERKLGEGGFGEVWLGRNPTTKQASVFKFCFQAERVRFLKRELTLFRLLKERAGDHPNIVAIRDVNLEQPPFYVEMEYVDGQDLRRWFEEHGGVEAIGLETRVEIVAQAAEGLQAAHDAGIVHRDVKPANILIGGKGIAPSEVRVKITDFGIGQVVSEEYLKGITGAGFTQTFVPGSSSQTGTQLYMAPELLAGKPASPRSDVYSLGVVLYQAILGDWGHPVTTDWATDIHDPLLQDDLRHCFAGKPDDRFTGPGQLGKLLRQLPTRRAEVERRQAELAERERAAYRRGIVRTGSLATVIVLVVSVLALVALVQSRKARVAAARATVGEQRARQNLYAADMLLAAQALEANNRGRAVQLLERYRAGGSNDLRGWEWRYLWTLCRSEALPLNPAHSNRVVDVAFSPGGDFLYTASEDNNVKVWNVGTRSLELTKPQGFSIQAMALSPDGRWLVTGSLGGRMMLWDTRVWTNESLPEIEGGLVDLLFSPAGDKLVLRSRFQLQILRAGDRQVLVTQPTANIFRHGQSMAVSPDGERLAYPAPGGRLALLELKPDWPIRFLPGELDVINSIAFSPDGKTLAAADWSPRIVLWDVAANRELGSLTNHAAWICSVAFSPDGKRLMSASADQSVKDWDTGTWQEVATRQGHLDEVHCLAISPQGDWMATGGKDGALNLWSTTPPVRPATRMTFARNRARLSRDGRTLLVFETNRTVTRWDAVALRPTGTNYAFPDAWTDAGVHLAFGGQHLAVGQPDGKVEVWDGVRFEKLTEWNVPSPPLSTLVFSSEETLLAVGSATRQLFVYERRGGRLRAQLEALPGIIGGVAFSPDGKHIVVAFTDGMMQLWNLEPKALLRTFEGQRQSVDSRNIAFSPDGRRFATGSADATLRLWNLEDGGFVSLPRALMAYFAVAYSPDGKRIAAAGPDSVVRIIDADTQQETASLQRNAAYRDFAENVRFTSDGSALLVMTWNSLTVWRSASFAEIEAGDKARERVLP